MLKNDLTVQECDARGDAIKHSSWLHNIPSLDEENLFTYNEAQFRVSDLEYPGLFIQVFPVHRFCSVAHKYLSLPTIPFLPVLFYGKTH